MSFIDIYRRHSKKHLCQKQQTFPLEKQPFIKRALWQWLHVTGAKHYNMTHYMHCVELYWNSKCVQWLPKTSIPLPLSVSLLSSPLLFLQLIIVQLSTWCRSCSKQSESYPAPYVIDCSFELEAKAAVGSLIIVTFQNPQKKA